MKKEKEKEKEKDSMFISEVSEEGSANIAEEDSVVIAEEGSEVVAEENPVDLAEESSEVVAEENPVDLAEESSEVVAEENPVIITQEEESKDTTKASYKAGLGVYLTLCIPVLLFPVLYFPYTLWWRRSFAAFAIRLSHEHGSRFLRLMITGNNTILLFWCVVTVVAMLAAIVMSVRRLRPWYIIPVYLAVMFSLCGILSLFFYTMIIR